MLCAIVLIYEMCIVCPFFVSFFVLSEFFCMCLNVACVDMGKCVGGWVTSIAKFSWRIIFVFIFQNLIVILIKCFLVLVSFVIHLYPWTASDSICLSKQIVISSSTNNGQPIISASVQGESLKVSGMTMRRNNFFSFSITTTYVFMI